MSERENPITNLGALFNVAQTFRVPGTNQPDQIPVTSIDLKFMYKPPAVDNQSGIENPGVTVYLTGTEIGAQGTSIPKIDANTFIQVARAEYHEIQTSSDGSVPTRFNFVEPVLIDANRDHAILVSYDGNESFQPWTAIKDNTLPGSIERYSGTNPNFQGDYYEFASSAGDRASNNDNSGTQSDFRGSLRPLDSTTLSFQLNGARFFIDGVPVSQSNTIPTTTLIHRGVPFQSWDSVSDHVTLIFPSFNVEGVSFDFDTSTVQSFIGAQKVFQSGVYYPGGFANNSSFVTLSVNNSVTITANTNYPNGTAFVWANVFNSYSGLKYITLFDTTLINIRKVVSIISNTVIQVDEPVTFTNAAAKFMISPVGIIDSMYESSPLGRTQHFMWLTQSNANSTVRFVNNCIETVTASVGGTGYSNADVLYIKGFENVTGKVTGGYVAIANLQTNSTGGITALYQSNLGCGFVNTSLIVATVANSTSIGNSTSNTSAGSGATFTYTTGATLKTELTNNIFKKCQIGNFGLNDVIPFASINAPTGTYYDATLKTQYYLQGDTNTFDGYAYYVNATPFSTPVQFNHQNLLLGNQIPSFISYSNEFVTHYSNGSINTLVNALNFVSNNIVLQINTVSNSDFVCVTVESPPTIEFGRYIINNDYTDEHTNSGNAWAKHLTTHINFTRLSEDIRVYLTAYRPANTDFQVYARIQNSNDHEAFDDKDWTRLQIIDGINIASSINNPSDYVELTYGFQSYPNSALVLAGSVATTNASAVVTGVGTAFSSNLAVGNVVRLYDPLFPNNNFFVAAVNSISNNTILTLDLAINSDENIALVAPGLKIEKLGYPHQAFNNPIAENVVRYYNSAMIPFDGYDNLQLKIVMLSSRQQNIPRIHDVRLAGVSA
jgi:hypothetical protein